MATTIIGLDLAKESFHVWGIDALGKKTLSRALRRAEVLPFFAQHPTVVVAMEACGGSNYFAQRLGELGHDPKIISAQYVKPFLKSQKNDANDAQAIAEAASRSSMRFVAVKEKWQQDIQILHRTREGIKKSKTALINQVRGFLMEYGVTIPEGVTAFESKIPIVLEDNDSKLTLQLRETIHELHEEYLRLKSRLDIYDRKLKTIGQQNEVCSRLQEVPEVGPLTATAFVAAIGDPKCFKNGRQASAWLGLVPRQHSTGGKPRLLGITKRGDSYLRSLLVHGSRAVLSQSIRKDRKDALSERAKKIATQSHYNKAAIAIANRNVRVMWAMMKSGEGYKKAA